ncbi:MAG: anthranilate phosphoribosyltransferase, partial [Deltaproteobacteria bacterium]|nr:anthranilate phosphoribosyltransferase [Deltaproteobacteria bacterium]
MFLIIDNYDSFTYNLVQAFQSLGQAPKVMRNDDPALLDLADKEELERVCLSPGPGHPREAGLCRAFMEKLLKKERPIPVLGVCLGHQVLAELAGSPVVLALKVMHGKVSPIEHDGKGLFRALPQGMKVGRYHSLIASEPGADMKIAFEVTARSPEGEIMALQYLDKPIVGVQFHPESVLTPEGLDLLANFLILEKDDKAIDSRLGQAQATPAPLSQIFESLGLGQDLNQDLATMAFERLMDGELSSAQAGALLLALRAKGETATEVAAAAKSVLERAVKVSFPQGTVLDVVGTGGDNRYSFNCSTATALTCAALGHRVLKHGNRSVSSRSGSADVLERLGFNIEISPTEIDKLLNKDNFVFLYAPLYHPCFKHIMPVRRELGVRTLFNILGPLVNPARPTHRLIGVYQPQLLDLMAKTLVELGAQRAAVVHGAGGYDELTPIGPAQTRIIKGGQIESLTLDPAEFGLKPCSEKDLAIKDPAEGAQVLRQVLAGRGSEAMRQTLAFNVGLALYLLTEDGMA